MIADNLMRDLSLGMVFENSVPVGNPMPAAYEISGQIYRFALEENGSTSSCPAGPGNQPLAGKTSHRSFSKTFPLSKPSPDLNWSR